MDKRVSGGDIGQRGVGDRGAQAGAGGERHRQRHFQSDQILRGGGGDRRRRERPPPHMDQGRRHQEHPRQKLSPREHVLAHLASRPQEETGLFFYFSLILTFFAFSNGDISLPLSLCCCLYMFSCVVNTKLIVFSQADFQMNLLILALNRISWGQGWGRESTFCREFLLYIFFISFMIAFWPLSIYYNKQHYYNVNTFLHKVFFV